MGGFFFKEIHFHTVTNPPWKPLPVSYPSESVGFMEPTNAWGPAGPFGRGRDSSDTALPAPAPLYSRSVPAPFSQLHPHAPPRKAPGPILSGPEQAPSEAAASPGLGPTAGTARSAPSHFPGDGHPLECPHHTQTHRHTKGYSAFTGRDAPPAQGRESSAARGSPEGRSRCCPSARSSRVAAAPRSHRPQQQQQQLQRRPARAAGPRRGRGERWQHRPRDRPARPIGGKSCGRLPEAPSHRDLERQSRA